MAKPMLVINGHDYAEHILELNPSRNDLDADGSGRDVQTGLMHRTRIATKQKWDVKLNRLSEADVLHLLRALRRAALRQGQRRALLRRHELFNDREVTKHADDERAVEGPVGERRGLA